MQEDEMLIDKDAAEFLEGLLLGINTARTKDPSWEQKLDVNSDDMMDGWNSWYYKTCVEMGVDPLEYLGQIDDVRPIRKAYVRKFMVRNGAETQLWNDAAEFYERNVGRGEELVIPVLPGRRLMSMYSSMKAALRRRGCTGIVVQCANTRFRFDYFMHKWVQGEHGKACIKVTHDKYARVTRQYQFFEECGGAVVWIKNEPFYGEFLGEEAGKLKFVLLMNDGERAIKFSPAYCNKVGQYAWKVND